VNFQRFADDFGDGPSRVQRAEGVLENHLEAAAAGAQFFAAQGGNVFTLEHNPAGGRLDELDGGAPERGLATTALTHQPNRFARRDGEAHAIHGAHEFLRPAKQALCDREVDLEVLDFEKVHARWETV
jgi:hypothetical protein